MTSDDQKDDMTSDDYGYRLTARRHELITDEGGVSRRWMT